MSSLTNRGASGDDSTARTHSTDLGNNANSSNEASPRRLWTIFRGGRELRCEIQTDASAERVAMVLFVDGERLSTHWFDDLECATREAQHWKEFARANLSV